MKFTLSWIKHFLNFDISVDKLSDYLTNIGFEVENILDNNYNYNKFQVAYIKNITSHPKSEKLKICNILTNQETNLNVVCGAKNLRNNVKVILASIDAIVPKTNLIIKKRNILGIDSYGMLCTESELLLGTDEEKVIILDDNAKIGDNICIYYELNDPVFSINVTPNRADALSIYGIARDLSATGVGELKKIAYQFNTKISDKNNIVIDIDNNLNQCKYLVYTEISNIINNVTPLWIKILLYKIGMSPNGIAVEDILTYVTESYGIPIYVLDREHLPNYVTVQGVDINGMPICLSNKKVINTKNCTLNTTSIVILVPIFNQSYISTLDRKFFLNVNNRNRYERGLDVNIIDTVINIAVDSIIKYCGGCTSDLKFIGDCTTNNKKIIFNTDLLEDLSNIQVDNKLIFNILNKLQFSINYIDEKNIEVTIPSWRYDINIPNDIVEEILRIYGYQNINETIIPKLYIEKNSLSSQIYQITAKIKRVIASIGYKEVITWSFMHSNDAKLIHKLQNELHIVNPISTELDYMRPSIIPNLLKLVNKNLSRSIDTFSIFEIGPIYNKNFIKQEINCITGIKYGFAIKKNFYDITSRKYNVFDVKLDIELILSYYNIKLEDCLIKQNDLPIYYHPNKSCIIIYNKNIIANFGVLHPILLKHFNLNDEVVAFELYINRININEKKFIHKEIANISNFPISKRDFSFIVNVNQPLGEIIKYIENIDSNLIKLVELFDIYHGSNIPLNMKSISVSIFIQHNVRNLNENDLSKLSEQIIEKLDKKFGAKLRV